MALCTACTARLVRQPEPLDCPPERAYSEPVTRGLLRNRLSLADPERRLHRASSLPGSQRSTSRDRGPRPGPDSCAPGAPGAGTPCSWGCSGLPAPGCRSPGSVPASWVVVPDTSRCNPQAGLLAGQLRQAHVWLGPGARLTGRPSPRASWRTAAAAAANRARPPDRASPARRGVRTPAPRRRPCAQPTWRAVPWARIAACPSTSVSRLIALTCAEYLCFNNQYSDAQITTA